MRLEIDKIRNSDYNEQCEKADENYKDGWEPCPICGKLANCEKNFNAGRRLHIIDGGGGPHDYRHVLSHCRGGNPWAVAVGHVPGVMTRTRRGSSPRTAPININNKKEGKPCTSKSPLKTARIL